MAASPCHKVNHHYMSTDDMEVCASTPFLTTLEHLIFMSLPVRLISLMQTEGDFGVYIARHIVLATCKECIVHKDVLGNHCKWGLNWNTMY